MVRWQNTFGVLVLTLLIGTHVCAREAKTHKYKVTHHSIEKNGKIMHFTVGVHEVPLKEDDKNSVKIKELVVEYDELVVAFHTKIPVLYARDLTGNGKFDAWFAPEPSGMFTTIEKDSLEDDGWDAAQDILINTIEIDKRPLYSYLLKGIEMLAAPVTTSTQSNFLKKIDYEILNLADLDLRTKRMVRLNSCDVKVLAEINKQYNLLAEGWNDISKQVQTNRWRNLPAELITDTLIDLSYYFVPKYFPAAAAKVGSATSKIPGVIYLAGGVRAAFGGMAKAAGEASAVAAQAAKRVIPASVLARVSVQAAAVQGTVRVLQIAVHKRVEASLARLASGNALTRIMANTLIYGGKGVAFSSRKITGTAISSIRIWPALVINQAMEFVDEAIVRWKEVSKDGIDLRIIKNIVSDPDWRQDQMFHFNQTFWADGIASPENTALTWPQKWIVLAGFSLADSAVVSLVNKNDDDLGRNVLDASWEMGFGSLGTLLDMRYVGKFNDMAKAKNNPMLKFVGWAIMPAIEFTELMGYTVTAYAYEHYWGKNADKEKEKSEAKEVENKIDFKFPASQACAQYTDKPADVTYLPVGSLSPDAK